MIHAQPRGILPRPRPAPPGTAASAGPAASIRSFVAIGDSFTEGLSDPRPDAEGLGGPGPGAGYRGWADRLADRLSEAEPALRYANLAVRGKLLDQVVRDQLPAALAAGADLVGFSAGANDILRPGADPDAIAAGYDDALVRLLAGGAAVLTFTGADPRRAPVMGRLRGRIATLNEHLRVIAARRGSVLVDLWGMPALQDPRAWGPDRIHLSPAGHARVALLAAAALGLPVESDPWEPWPDPPPAPRSRAQARRDDIAWAGAYLLPWAGRRLRGRSTGDGRAGKRPELAPWRAESW
ncbi:MAG: SGNH/GDSL hydrolase family protein [Frankiaceae bacterium]|jgi:lysophospholipase L1-like esterase|nr:SGNH/GDSL hydrolase family protein [Frankiaceae bacterium]